MSSYHGSVAAEYTDVLERKSNAPQQLHNLSPSRQQSSELKRYHGPGLDIPTHTPLDLSAIEDIEIGTGRKVSTL